MKKVLFATTALVLSAGVAAAEVTVSGDGRMGIVYNGETEKSDFNSRIRAIFTMSGETDGGLTFGGSFRADHVNAISENTAFGGTAQNGGAGTVYIGGAFGKLSMGDTDSAAENAVGDVSGVGYTQPSGLFATARETEYLLGAGAADPHLLYSYEFGDFALYASMTDGNNNGARLVTDEDTGSLMIERNRDRNEGYSLGVTYGFGDFGVSAGYETLSQENTASSEQWLIGGNAGFGDLTLKAFYAQGDVADEDFQQYGASLDVTFGATTITGFGRVMDYDNLGKDTYMGIGAAYALGGGATLKAGIIDVDQEASGTMDDIVADFGVIFTF